MKFLSATAVFAAALPSVTEASTSESQIKHTDLSSNRIGSSSSPFTETVPAEGAEYKISGDVSFSSFSNISEDIKDKDPSSPDSEHEENEETDEASSESLTTNTEENTQTSSSETPEANSRESAPQEPASAPEGSSSSTTTSSQSISPDQPQNNAIALRSFLYSLQAETEEAGQASQEGVSNGDATHPESAEEGQQESPEEGQQEQSKNTSSGGGAFYNPHNGPLSLVNNPKNPGSLTLSQIRVTGEGGAIYSKGPLSIKDLKQLVLKENLSKKAGGAILGESTVTITGVDTLTFSKNAVEVTFVDPSDTQNPPAGSEPEGASGSSGTGDSSDSSDSSDLSSSGGSSNGVSSDAQAVAFSRFLSASPSVEPQPEAPENANSSLNVKLGCGGGIYSKGKLTVSDSKEISFNENSATKDGGGIYSENDISVSSAEKVLFTGNTAGVVGKESATDKEQTPTDQEQGPQGTEQDSQQSPPNSVSSQQSSPASARLTQLSLTRSASAESGGSQDQANSLQQTEQASEGSQQDRQEPENHQQGQETSPQQEGETSSNETQNADQSASESDPSSGSESSGGGSPSPTTPQSPTPEVIKPVVGRGGAVYTEKSLTVTDVTKLELVNNSATGAGGAIYAVDKVAFTTTKASNAGDARDPGETIISDNQASGCGGGVCTKVFSASNLKTLTLSKNTSKESGGAIYTDLAALKTPESLKPEQSTTPPSSTSGAPAAAAKISRFVATTSAPQSETVVASPDSDIDVFIKEVLKVSITENKAAKKGGGVYGKKAKFSNLDKLDISNNTAQDIGGGLCLTESVEFDAIGSLSTSNNSAIAQGAGIHAKTVTITNTKSAFTFANNTVKATEDPKPEVAQPEESAPSEEGNQPSTPNDGQTQAPSEAEGNDSEEASNENNDQEAAGEEESASTLSSERNSESEAVPDSNESNQPESQVRSNSEENEQAERSDSTSFSIRNNENSESEAQHLPEPSPETSSTEETLNSTSENNVVSNNNSINTDSGANTDSTEGNQDSQTGGQEHRDSNEDESVSSSAGSEEQRTESENTNSRDSSQSEPSAANSEQEVASEEESASASSLETNNENSVSETHTLSEPSQETPENRESEEATPSAHTQNSEQTPEVENSEASNQVSSESSTNSLETQAAASSRVAILSSANTVVSSSDASSPSESSRSDTDEEETEAEAEAAAAAAESPDGETQPEGSSNSPTLVAGGAIWGDTVKIENFSGNGTFSNNKVIDNKPSESKAHVLGGAIYAKTSLDINNENSNRSIIFSENSVSSKSTSGQVAGGAIFSPTVTIKAPVVFSKNSATHEGTKPKDEGASPKNGSTTLKDTFGGAIGATTSVSISNGARFSENTADIGSAIGLVAGAIPVDNNSGAATVSDPATPSTTPDPQNENAVRLEGGSYYFEKNKALKRATIYAPTVSIKAYTATFNQNSSAEEGSAIYFTKEASIESLGSVLFTGNLVTPTTSTAVLSTEAVQKYGAAIFGQLADANAAQPASQTTPENLPLKLIASGGNISFRNNEYRPNAADIGQSTFCSIGGDVKLTMQAAEGKTISFFDAIRTTTKKTGTQASAYDTLDINKSNDAGAVNSAFRGTIMFSSELHENKSYIPQNVVLHSGSLVLKANTELHVISFEQKEGSSLIMEPGAVLSNQATADGSLVINSLTIDLSSVGTTVSSGGGIFTPPELRIVNTTGGGNSGASAEGSSGTQAGGSNGGADSNSGGGGSGSGQDASNSGSGSGSTGTDNSNGSGGENGASSSTTSSSSAPASSSAPSPAAALAQASIAKNLAAAAAAPAAPTAPGTIGNQVIIDGVITLVDPNGTFFQNPALGSDQTISLLVLPKDPTQMQAQKVVLTGDVSPQKGYTGTLTLDLNNLQNGIQANWKFDSYRQWAYIPRDNHFYANSILGSQMSMATVKQGLINDKLNLARFDEVAYNNLWVSGVGTKLSQRGGPRSEEMTYYSRGASVALDAKPAQDLIIGAAFSKMIGRSKSLKQEHNYTHKGSEYSYQASVYGGRPFHLVMNRGTERTLPLLLQGVISYGYIKHDTVTHYPTIRERNKGEWEDLGWLAALRLSSVLKAPTQGDSKRISVFGEFEYSSIRQKQFTETEYDPRYFGNCTYRNLATPLGIALEGEFKGNDILMYNRFSVAYMPSIYRNSPVCKYKVLSSGEGGEIICGVPTRNTSRAEYSTQLYLGPLWTLYGSYTLEADAHTLANMINCGARMTF